MNMVLSPLVALTVGVAGAALVVTLAVREWRRLNAARAQPVPVRNAQREQITRLRRDPATGIYRPDR